MRFTWVIASCLLLSLSTPTSAAAQHAPAALSPEAQAEAQALFRRAVELGAEDRWSEALELFRRSREIAARPNTIFNIGFALYRLGRLSQAIEVFDEYTATAGPADVERRSEAVRLRGEAAAALVQLELDLDPADARVLVDGARVERDPAGRIVLDPGRHILRVTRTGYEDAEVEVAVLAGERGVRAVHLIPRVEAPASSETVVRIAGPSATIGTQEGDIEDPGTEPQRGLIDEPVFWVVLVVGALVVGASVAVGVVVGTQGAAPPSGGSSGVVLEGLRF